MPPKVFIDGHEVFDRASEKFPLSDFEVGIHPPGLNDGRGFAKSPQGFQGFKAPPAPPGPDRPLMPGDSFAVENVRVEVGDGTALDGATVLVRGGRIARVAKGDSTSSSIALAERELKLVYEKA